MVVSDVFVEVNAAVQAGELPSAKHAVRTLLDSAEPAALEVIADVVHIVTNYPRIARAKLTHLLRVTELETGRAIIAACIEFEAWEHGAALLALWDQRRSRENRNAERAPSTCRTEIRPEFVGTADPRRGERLRRSEAVSAAYASRAGIDDVPDGAEPPLAYLIDYDRAALPVLRGMVCVECWVERASCDIRQRADDGLCTVCRERGRTGIGSLQPNHTVADVITARLQFLAARHAPATARTLLRMEWTRSPSFRHHIEKWVRDHRDVIDAPAAAPDLAALCECGGHRQVRHGQCADCRQLV